MPERCSHSCMSCTAWIAGEPSSSCSSPTMLGMTCAPCELTSHEASPVYVLLAGTILVRQLQKICVHSSASSCVHRMLESFSAMALYDIGSSPLSFFRNLTAVVSSIAADSGAYFIRKSGHSSQHAFLKNSVCALSATSMFITWRTKFEGIDSVLCTLSLLCGSRKFVRALILSSENL